MIHEICYHGNGGYDYHTIYDMPIWLRTLTHNLLIEQKSKENEAYSKNYSSKNNKQINLNNPEEAKKILNQSNTPTYITKASKK